MMRYLMSFLEGIITFISPCLLPMLPVYISYFAGQKTENRKYKAIVNSLGFVLGFTVLFITLGALSGGIGTFLDEHQTVVNIVCGAILIVFGLNFTGIVRIPFLNRSKQFGKVRAGMGFLSSILFGMVFSVSWTPCIGAFLSTALLSAAQTGGMFRGIMMLLCFSLGLGIPFILSAVLIDKLKGAFDFIKRHYKVINIVSGCLLIVLGILMAAGFIGYLYALI